jgi:hypothetical protein
VQKPEQRNSNRESFMNESGRERERQAARGERASQSGSRNQIDNSTYRNLERDRAARVEGSKRTTDHGSYSRSRGNAGSFRGGGFSRGGGFRGGGRR